MRAFTAAQALAKVVDEVLPCRKHPHSFFFAERPIPALPCEYSKENGFCVGLMSAVETIRQAILDEVDWDAIWRRLIVLASRITREMPGVFDGISAEDLAGETLTAFLVDPSGLGWNPTTEDNLARFLCGVLKNKFMTHRRRSRSREAAADERPVAPASVISPAQDSMADRIEAVAKGKRDLEELVEASRDIEDSANINQQLSMRLKTTVQDVINRKRRLIRSLKKADWPSRNCVSMQTRIIP